jgi:hypothetical protein
MTDDEFFAELEPTNDAFSLETSWKKEYAKPEKLPLDKSTTLGTNCTGNDCFIRGGNESSWNNK